MGLTALTLTLAGCQRGCLSGWFETSGLFGAPAADKGGAFSLASVDCPGGMARCVGGVVEMSRAATLGPDCQGAPGGCACPWTTVGSCEGPCAVDELELALEAAVAHRQLCAPPSGEAVALPLLTPPASPLSSCQEDATAECRDGTVYRCGEGAPPQPELRCLRGCVAEGLALDTLVPPGSAAAVLCLR